MTNNLVDLYAVMQSFGYIKSEDFNLEGVTYDGWYLFNRGNSDANKNVLSHFTPKKTKSSAFFQTITSSQK
jgi:hypothetical protein